MGVDISVILPAYDEAENLPVVVGEVLAVFDVHSLDGEVVVVDDGSGDGTGVVAAALGEADGRVRCVPLRRNFGKSAALQAGFEFCSGDVVVLMDADGQDDPAEVPRLLDALDGGLDLCTGRRTHRRDRFVKRHTSRLYNWATARVTGVEGRDMNSGLKAMRRDVALDLDLHGELHRYIPVLAHWAGYRTGEIDVHHRPRLHGRTKFGRARFWRGVLDLATVKLLTTYTARPLHLFGGLAAVLGAAGGALLAWMATLKLSGGAIGDRPALLAGILLVVVAVQLFSIGLLAELVVHTRRPQPLGSLVRRSD
ncbi:MAG: glycosyltransferase family 2 protein [Actinomycetota bacterium]|nr:glycosyltransferase family 2 protein [Actinomycetota bacterium]